MPLPPSPSIYGDLTPRRVFDLCPPLLIKERGEDFREGLAPLLNTPTLLNPEQGETKPPSRLWEF